MTKILNNKPYQFEDVIRHNMTFKSIKTACNPSYFYDLITDEYVHNTNIYKNECS